MALPAMITDFGAQQANYGAAVGQSLAQLGQQVGQQLAMREYQKQAAAALPAMQASYKSAFDKMGQGQYADGYMELLNTNLQFGATTNPFIAQFAEQANQTAKQMESALWRQAQYGGMKSTGATQPRPSLLPAFEEAGGMEGMEAIDVTDQTVDFTQPVVEVPLPGEEQAPVPSAVAIPPQEEQLPPPMARPTPIQNKAATAARKYFSLAPNEQAALDKETTYTMEELKNNYEVAPVAGLSRFIPGATGVGIPKPTERKEKRISITNEGRQTLSIEKKYLEETTNKAKEFASNLADAVAQVESSADAMEVIAKAGGINRITAKKSGDLFYVKPVTGGEEIEVDENTYRAIDTIKGARAIGAASAMPIVVGRYDFGTVEEAEASGLPSGTIVYINGRKARID